MDNGNLVSANVDSLAAFFPGLQVLMGDIEAYVDFERDDIVRRS